MKLLTLSGISYSEVVMELHVSTASHNLCKCVECYKCDSTTIVEKESSNNQNPTLHRCTGHVYSKRELIASFDISNHTR